MDFDVAQYRRAAERLEKMDRGINPLAAVVLILQLCDEVERLQQHRCLWGNDPSGPYCPDIVEGKNNCQRWISVEERLPEEDRLVLWHRPDERWPVTSGRFERPHYVNYGGALCVPFSEGRYTHWMPLPEPPEVK